MTPTKNDTTATIVWLDASDMTLTDADTMADGDNVIKVKVTAEDTTATRTYTVTVNRPAATPSTCTLNTGDLWCGVVTVGAIEKSGSITAYGFDSSVGSLSDTGFSVGTNNYTIDAVSIEPGVVGYVEALIFSLTSALTAADRAKVVLHVDGSSNPLAFNRTIFLAVSHGYQWGNTGLDWSSTSEVTLRLREADVTLSGLVVNDGSKDLALTPTFASNMYAYDASVASTVDEVTVTPTQNDTTATIEYLDASDMTLTDADTSADGQQVALAEGDNVINVKVTAADTTTTLTYKVTVNRPAAAPTCTLNTGDLWCGVVTVATINVAFGIIGYGFSDVPTGALSDTEFSVGTNDYTIDVLYVIGAETLHFGLTSALTAADRAKLVVYVGSDTFAFSTASHSSVTNNYVWSAPGLDWSSATTATVRLRALAASDATLSGLVVNDGSKDLALTPAFASDTYAYDASVGNTVDEVTVTPTKNDTTATIEYLDASDNALTDADTLAGRPAGDAAGGRQRHQGEGDGRGHHYHPDLHGDGEPAGGGHALDLHAEHRRRRHLVRRGDGGRIVRLRWIPWHDRQLVRHPIRLRIQQLHDRCGVCHRFDATWLQSDQQTHHRRHGKPGAAGRRQQRLVRVQHCYPFPCKQ